MGCGASKQEQQQQPQETGPKPLSQDEKNQIAVNGLKDAMKWALDQSIMLCSDENTWTSDTEIKIKVPVQDKIDTLSEKVGGLPIVGGGLKDALLKTTEPFDKAFAEAGMDVSKNPRTIMCFSHVIGNIEVADAIPLCRAGGVSACVDYVKEKGVKIVKESLVAVVDEVMKDHALTKIWGKFIDSFNSTAGKAPGIEPIEFNLNEYVLDCALDAIFLVMMRKEKEIRAAPGQAVSAAVRQAFGSDPSEWKRQ